MAGINLFAFSLAGVEADMVFQVGKIPSLQNEGWCHTSHDWLEDLPEEEVYHLWGTVSIRLCWCRQRYPCCAYIVAHRSASSCSDSLGGGRRRDNKRLEDKNPEGYEGPAPPHGGLVPS